MASGYDQLPEAVLEETVHPDEVILIPQDGGAVHMLLYSGQAGDGYISLKYVVLDEKHVKGIVAATTQGGADAVPVAPLVDLTQLQQPVFVDDDVIRRA